MFWKGLTLINKNSKKVKFFSIAIAILFVVGWGTYFFYEKNSNAKPTFSPLEVRILAKDIEEIEKEFKDFSKEDFLSKEDNTIRDIDALDFEVVDAGLTADLLYVDLVVHELGKEDTLSFVSAYEDVLKEELQAEYPSLQIRLFPSEQHYIEELPKYVYVDGDLYTLKDANVKNQLETLEEKQDDTDSVPVGH